MMGEKTIDDLHNISNRRWDDISQPRDASRVIDTSSWPGEVTRTPSSRSTEVSEPRK
jgi:hypothetical protein